MPQVTAPSNVPSSGLSRLKISYFRGVDLTDTISGVDVSRSCNGVNMIRDVPGKVRKRMGYRKIREYRGVINGLHTYGEEMLVHAGDRLYRDGDEPSLLYEGLADGRSFSIEFSGKLLLLDGKRYLIYDGEQVRPADDDAYVPTVVISRSPNGGGVSYEAVNMLSRKRKESFAGTEADCVYQLSFDGLADDAVTVTRRTADGGEASLTEGTDFSVDRKTGRVTFVTPPGVSPVTGEDNVTVCYAVDNGEYLNRINGCRFMTAYGAYGALDRVFMSGNSGFPNRDFFSALNDPTYMGDINYGVLGQEQSPITGYSIVNNRLAAHKLGDDDGRNIFLRYGTADTSDEPLNDGAVFPIVDVIQGPGAITPYTFGYSKEPMFLTSEGICATTPYEYNSQRYVQNRSFYLNEPLVKEPQLEDAFAVVFNELYMLSVGDSVYILDTMQPAAGKGERSDFQYEAYFWKGVPAHTMSVIGKRLIFGDKKGSVYEFYTDPDALLSYNDDGKPIAARWDTDFSGSDFYAKKRIKYVSLRMAAAPATSCEIWRRLRGVWSRVAQTGAKARYWSYQNLVYSKLTYSNDMNPRTIGKKVRIKRFDTVRLSFRNEALNEPFGLYELAVIFGEGGIYRG